jgi:hypothetical protein
MAVGYLETWSSIFLLVSLAGTGSRGYRVPLAELSNVLLLILMAGAVYTHRVLGDGQAYVPATLGAEYIADCPPAVLSYCFFYMAPSYWLGH